MKDDLSLVDFLQSSLSCTGTAGTIAMNFIVAKFVTFKAATSILYNSRCLKFESYFIHEF